MKQKLTQCICILLILLAISQGRTQTTRPNIVVIFSDDHALQAISAYGSPHITTPNIDRIAREGALFKNALCTNSLCAPSRAVLLTGKYNHINGQIDNRTGTVMDTRQPSFPMYLQQSGYTTAWIGKWHISNTPRYFDYWKVLPGQGNYYNPDFILMDSSRMRQTGYVTDLITDEAIQWLDKSKGSDKPFCLVIGQKAPHREWQPDIQDLHTFDNKTFKLPDNYFDQYDKRNAAAHQLMEVKDLRWDWDLKVNPGNLSIFSRMNAEQLKGWNAYYEPLNARLDTSTMSRHDIALWKYQRYMHDYLSCILSLDRNIGRVLEYLDKNDLTNNTIVIYSSDQGFYLGEHGWFDKRFMYEPSLHMPLMIRYPGVIKPHTVIDNLVVNIDYAPTLLDFAGLPIPDDMQGKSFKSLVASGKKDNKWRKNMYYHYYEYPDSHRVMPHFGLRSDRYKLICFYEPKVYWELYDLKKDKNEMKNIYTTPGNYKLIAALKGELKDLILEYKDNEAQLILDQE